MNFNKAKFDSAYGISSQLPKSDKIEVAFAGRSNVGKSSLLNKIFNRKNLARVSSVPGKTITINFYDVDGNRLVDLPGYGYANVSKQEKSRFSELMEVYFNGSRQIKLVLLLIDSRHAPSKDDYNMLTFLQESNIPFVVVLTKTDKLKKREREERFKAFEEELQHPTCTVIPFSAVTGEGVEEVRNVIEKTFE